MRRRARSLSRAAIAIAVASALSPPLAALTGCAAVSVPDEAPSIVGTVETVDGGARGQSLLTMLVRGEPREGATYDAASVTVTRDTAVLAGTRKDPAGAAAGDIAEGDEVMVWFTGPVAESYPVQATAGTVLVLGE